jgi:hypothetical protein
VSLGSYELNKTKDAQNFWIKENKDCTRMNEDGIAFIESKFYGKIPLQLHKSSQDGQF